jgi:hypothetical protein
VYLPAKPELMQILVKGNYLVRTNDDMVCRIKKVELDTDAENGDYLIVTGKDTKDLCDQRIIWSTMTCDGNLETFIRKIVTTSLINPSMTARKVLKPNSRCHHAVFRHSTFRNAGGLTVPKRLAATFALR